jgi:hypothetical protein
MSDDAFDRLANEAAAAIPEPAVDTGKLAAVVARARHRRTRRRTLVAVAAVILIAVGVVGATTGRGHSQQVASVGPTTTGPTSPARQSDGPGASLAATVKYLRKHLTTMVAACDKSADAYAKTHVGEPPPTTAATGTPEVDGMEAFTGPTCQTGYVPLSGPDAPDGPGVVSPVRLKPSPDAPVVGYLVEGISGWIPATDFAKYDPQTLIEAEHELEAEPPPAGAITRPSD